MATEATNPGKLSVLAPIRLNSYLGDNENTRIFQWVFNQDSDLIPGSWSTLLMGNSYPSIWGWTPVGTGASTTLDKNRVITTNVIKPQLYYYKDSILGDNAVGNTVEANIKIDSVAGGLVQIVYDDGTYTETLIINATEAYFLNANLKYSFNTTDAFHTYTITVIGTVLKLFVDGIFRISTTITTPGSSNRLSFGNFGSPTGTTTSRWYVVKCNEEVVEPAHLVNADYELLVDSVNTFDSINLKTYTVSSGLISVHNDGVVAAFAISIPPRQTNGSNTFYWKVRVNSTSYISSYTDVQSYDLDQNLEEEIFQRLWAALPDEGAYSKNGDSGNISALFRAYASEVSDSNFEVVQTTRDSDYSQTRDSNVSSILGSLLRIDRNKFQNIAEYRDTLKELLAQYFVSTTQASVENIVQSITGKKPDIEEQYKQSSWTLGEDYYIFDPDYPLLTPYIKVFSAEGNAFTWEIHIYNPYDFAYDRTLVAEIIQSLKPAHTELIINFYNVDGILLQTYLSYYGISEYYIDSYTDPRFIA